MPKDSGASSNEGQMPDLFDGDSLPNSEDDALRLVLFKMWMHSQQLFRERFGDNDTVLITIAVGMGRIANSPVDISTISEITGISRPTVRRRLEKLTAEGRMHMQRVGNRTLVVSTESAVEATQPLTRQWADLVSRAAREIESLEGKRRS